MPSLVARVGVLADDFSGAGDVALAFGAVGVGGEIWIPAGGKPKLPGPGVSVWILDTESRGLPGSEAARRVRLALAALAHWKPDFIFKKIDSTLRGPVAAELAAFIKGLHPQGPVAVVPAFPQMGRTTVGGRHFVGGVPLHRTAFGKDPRHPVRSNRVEEILAGGSPEALRGRVWIPDISNDRDLSIVARRVLAGGRVAVGSAGFARAVARAMGRIDLTRPPGKVLRRAGTSPVGVVVGSAHPMAGRQAARLKNSLSGGNVFLLERPGRRGSPSRVLRRLMEKARVLEIAHGIRRWVVTGGETAFALARRWKASRWRIVERFEPGVPLCRSLGSGARWLVLKPGGFGSLDVLRKAVRQLSRMEDRPMNRATTKTGDRLKNRAMAKIK